MWSQRCYGRCLSCIFVVPCQIVCSTHPPGHSALRDGIRAELGERRGGCQGHENFMVSFLWRSCQVEVEPPQGDDGDGGRDQARPWRMISCGCKFLKCKAHAQLKLAELKPKVRAKACMVCHTCLCQVYVVPCQKRPRSPPARARKVRFCRVCCMEDIVLWQKRPRTPPRGGGEAPAYAASDPGVIAN